MYSELIYKMSKTTRVKGPYILGVIIKHQGVWGCESEEIKGAYKNN